MVQSVNSNNNRHYMAGASTGLVLGAGTGALTVKKGAKNQIEALETAKDAYDTALTAYKQEKLISTGESALYDLINNAVHNDKDVVELRQQAKNAPQNKKLLKQYKEKFAQKQQELLKKPENKSLQETLNVAEKEFNNTQVSADLKKTVQEASDKLKGTKIKWIAGIAAAGAVAGLAISHLIHRNQK